MRMGRTKVLPSALTIPGEAWKPLECSPAGNWLAKIHGTGQQADGHKIQALLSQL